MEGNTKRQAALLASLSSVLSSTQSAECVRCDRARAEVVAEEERYADNVAQREYEQAMLERGALFGFPRMLEDTPVNPTL